MNTNIDDLIMLLHQLRKDLRISQRNKWKRSLSMEDELFDRWERAKFLKFGEGTSIYQSSLVFGDVTIGKNTWIGPFTILDGSGTLIIGDNCSISSGVQIYTHDTVAKRISNGKHKIERKKTIIGNSCYIGPLSVIKKGITIGNNSIIGTLSYVNKNVEPFSVVVGTPAKKIANIIINDDGSIEYDYIQKNTDELELKISELEKEIKKLKEKINYGEEN